MKFSTLCVCTSKDIIHNMSRRANSKNICVSNLMEVLEKLTLSYTDGSNTGWNSECSFKRIELSSGDVGKMDNGLNSAWKILL